MDLSNKPNLEKLVHQILEPFKEDPALLIEKLVPPTHAKLILKAEGLLSGLLGLSLEKMAGGFLSKIETLPSTFWVELEKIVKGCIEGEEDAHAKALEFFGVMKDESRHQAG